MSKPKVDPLEALEAKIRERAWASEDARRAAFERGGGNRATWDLAFAAGNVAAYEVALQYIARAQRKAKKERTR